MNSLFITPICMHDAGTCSEVNDLQGKKKLGIKSISHNLPYYIHPMKIAKYYYCYNFMQC